jgi:hypothetical protein
MLWASGARLVACSLFIVDAVCACARSPLAGRSAPDAAIATGIDGRGDEPHDAGAASSFDGELEVASAAPGPCDVTKLAVGASHTCVLRGDGRVTCWGANEVGQLGDGTKTAHPGLFEVPEPVRDVSDLWSGYQSSCAARKGGGRLMCWGLGAPVTEVTGVEAAPRQVALGAQLCLSQDGRSIRCAAGGWMDLAPLRELNPSQGELIVGLTMTDRTVCATIRGTGDGQGPRVRCTNAGSAEPPLQLDVRYRQVSGLWEALLAVDVEGRAWQRAFTNDFEPVGAVGAPVAAVFGTGSGHFACLLTVDGAVWCWGDNGHGALADRAPGWTPASQPRRIAGIEGPVQQVGLGFDHACALSQAGAVWCWGGNYGGQAVPGATGDVSTPTRIALCH